VPMEPVEPRMATRLRMSPFSLTGTGCPARAPEVSPLRGHFTSERSSR
jgi:hypothetical protein